MCETDCKCIAHWKGLMLCTIFLFVNMTRHVWNLKKICFIFKGLIICCPWQLCKTTTSHGYLAAICCHHLWTDLFSVYLSLPLNLIQIQQTLLNATKLKPSWGIFSKAGHLTLMQSLSPEKRSGSLTLSPAFHLHLKWLQTGLSAKWMEEASTVSKL